MYSQFYPVLHAHHVYYNLYFKLLFDICCRDTQYALFESFVRKTLDDIRADKKVCFDTRTSILDFTLRIEDRMWCA